MGGESAKMVAAYISARAGLKGHDDAIHTIHAGTDHNVELRLSDLTAVVENYAALLEALQLAANEISEAEGYTGDSDAHSHMRAAQKAINAAIALATGAA